MFTLISTELEFFPTYPKQQQQNLRQNKTLLYSRHVLTKLFHEEYYQ